MGKKFQPSKSASQKESLPGFDPSDDSSEENPLAVSPAGVRAADERDLAELQEMTNSPDAKASLEEIRSLGESALPHEVQLSDAEDLNTLQAITDEELARIENMLSHPSARMSRRTAEIRVLGRNRALRLRGEKIPQSSPPLGEKSIYDQKGPYPRGHPKKPSSRLRGIADERSAKDPWLR